MQLSQVNISQKLQLIVRAATVHPMMIKWWHSMLLQMTADALTIGYPMKDKIEGIKTIKFYVFTT